MLVLSGLSLGLSLGKIFRLQVSALQQALAGVILVGFIWAGVMKVQSIVYARVMLQSRNLDGFASIDGHCGPHLANALHGLVDGMKPGPDQLIQDFFRHSECRNAHFLVLEKKGGVDCIEGESPVDCRLRWMGVFAERGYWTYSTRKMFFDRIMNLWNENKNIEQLVNYVLRDHEIETGRLSLVKQIGLDHGRKEMVALQVREDVEHLRLTEKLFSQARAALDDQKDKTAPYYIKFKDASLEANAQLARLPDYEKALKKLSGTGNP